MTFTKVLVGRANLCPICKEPINFSIICPCTTVYTEVSSPCICYNSVQTIAIETKLHNTICIWRERERERERESIITLCRILLSYCVAVVSYKTKKGRQLAHTCIAWHILTIAVLTDASILCRRYSSLHLPVTSVQLMRPGIG